MKKNISAVLLFVTVSILASCSSQLSERERLGLKGKVKTVEEFSGLDKNTIYEWSKSYFTEEGKLIETRFKGYAETDTSIQAFEYDENGYLKKAIITRNPGGIKFTTHYYKTESGDSTILKGVNDGKDTTDIVWYVDEMIVKKLHVYDSTTQHLIYIKYDQERRPLEYEHTLTNNKPVQMTITYAEADAQGNWTIATMNDKESKMPIGYRKSKIVYYP